MKRITNLELGALSYFLIRAFFIYFCFSNVISVAKQDSYISIFCGILMGGGVLASFYYLFNFEPSLTIFGKFKKLFGNIIGNFINVILLILTFILAAFIFLNLISLIYNQYLNKTPVIFISLVFTICIFYSLYKGINSTLRTCIILFILSIMIYLISALGLIFKININNFKPVGFNPFIKASFSYISYSVMPLYLLLLIPKNKIIKNRKTSITMLFFYIIASISLLLVVLIILGNLGIKLTLLYDYPEFQILKYVYVTGLSSRLDSLLFIQWIFDMLIFIIFSLHFVSRGIMSLRNKAKKNIIYIILSCLLFILNQKLFSLKVLNQKFSFLLANTIFTTIISITLISIVALLFKEDKITSGNTSQNNTHND